MLGSISGMLEKSSFCLKRQSPFGVQRRNDALEMARLYAVLHAFENEIRSLIRDTLDEKIGANWWETESVPKKVRDMANSRQKTAEKGLFGLRNENRSLEEFIDFGDLSAIIVQNWEHFKELVPTQLWIRQRMTELEKARNFVAHNRMLLPLEFQRIYMYVSDWNKVIGLWFSLIIGKETPQLRPCCEPHVSTRVHRRSCLAPSDLRRSSMPPRPLRAYHRKIRRDDLQPDPAQEAALAGLERLYDELAAGRRNAATRSLLGTLISSLARNGQAPPVRGVWLWGPVGRGKSMLMDMFGGAAAGHRPSARAFPRLHDRGPRLAASPPWRHGRHAAARPRGGDRRTMHGDLLDEFHVHDVADAMMLERLSTGLLDGAASWWSRPATTGPTICTRGGLQRELFLTFIALLKQRLEVIHLNGAEDYRARCLQVDGTYFSPLGSAARRRADKVFGHLTDHATPHEEALEVKRRKIRVPVVAKGAARLSFAELCGQPHGAEDYLDPCPDLPHPVPRGRAGAGR